MKLIIEDDEGRKTVVPVVRDEITIGRNDECLVRLTEKNVSRKHGRLLREEGQFYIEDLNSFTGIRVNGQRIAGKHLVREGDLIQISEYDLSLQAGPGEKLAEQAASSGEAIDEGDEPTHVGGASAAEAKAPEAAPEKPAPTEEPATAPPSADEEAEKRKMAETATIRLSDLKPLTEVPAQDVPTAERPRLVGISGTYRGKELVLDRTPIRLGRSDENDVQIDHPSISRKHCRLHLDGGTWKVMDAESRNGVRVNGENYASIGLRHGDVLEIGHLRFAFVAAGQPFQLPSEFAPVSGIAQQPVRPANGKGLLIGGLVGLLVAGGAAVLFLARKADSREGERAFALRSAEEATAEHHYGEALRDLDAARRAGAHKDELAKYAEVQNEARSEDLYREMESAAASQDWERARKLLGVLATSKTYWGGKASEKAEAITAGYVNLHIAAAALMKGKDNAGCLSEAQLALGANPHSADAQSLVDACKQPQSAASDKAAEKGPAVKAASMVAREEKRAASRPDNDAEGRRLLNEGNQKLIGQDYAGAITVFKKALALKPGNTVLAGLYRSMGIAYTRQGDIESGARYYKLYLPLCTNAAEKAQLQKVLDDYDARSK
jgi:pSer/pThr/pTyr-binding forkhead associated (FHA) protein